MVLFSFWNDAKLGFKVQLRQAIVMHAPLVPVCLCVGGIETLRFRFFMRKRGREGGIRRERERESESFFL